MDDFKEIREPKLFVAHFRLTADSNTFLRLHFLYHMVVRRRIRSVVRNFHVPNKTQETSGLQFQQSYTKNRFICTNPHKEESYTSQKIAWERQPKS